LQQSLARDNSLDFLPSPHTSTRNKRASPCVAFTRPIY